jgi:hypothetical protein
LISLKYLPRLYFAAAIALALSWPGRASAIDFTPIEVETMEDGGPQKHLAFHEDQTAIFIRPPKGWQMLGGGEEVTFSPTPPLEGEVRLGNSTFDPSIRFEKKGLITYRAGARSQLPKQAKKIEVLSEMTGAFPLDNWQSFEISFSYDLGGVKRVRSMLFVTMNPHRQVRLVADSSEKNFEEVHAAARAVLGSWFEPPAGWLTSSTTKTP